LTVAADASGKVRDVRWTIDKFLLTRHRDDRGPFPRADRAEAQEILLGDRAGASG
jgi:hypothetical protein